MAYKLYLNDHQKSINLCMRQLLVGALVSPWAVQTGSAVLVMSVVTSVKRTEH